MPKIDSNASAYPDSSRLQHEPGLTKREAFILAAMQGLCANPGTISWNRAELRATAITIADDHIAAINAEEVQE